MNFQWNGEFSWFCTECEIDGSFTAQTQQQVFRMLRQDHAASVAECIRSGEMKLPCESRTITLFLNVSIDSRMINGRIPRQNGAGKLHKRRVVTGGQRAECWSAGKSARLTDDDDAVTCRTCRFVMNRERENARLDAEWERTEELKAVS